MLNKQQQQAVDQTEGPVLIIAGAGSGKTTTLIERTANIIQKGVSPQHILMLTFTNKAANEMKARGAALLDERFSYVTACTYHSFCHILLQKYRGFLGAMGEYSILDQVTATDIMQMLITKNPRANVSKFPQPGSIISLFSAAANMGLSVADAVLTLRESWEHWIPVLKELSDGYADYKRTHSQMDYDDLMLETISLLEDHPELRDILHNRYKYIMVDEYQDSNSIQLKLLKLLCNNDPYPNICVVGDDQQSIYLFRGAEFANIINYPNEFPGCQTIILNINYRSNQEICDVANSIIEDAPEKYKKDLQGTYSKGAKPIIAYGRTVREEKEYIVNTIVDYIKAGIDPKEIAVLSRTSRATSMIEAELNKLDISFEKYGGIQFLDRTFVKDMLAILKISVYPLDEIAWFRWLCVYPKIGNKTAIEIYSAINAAGGVERTDLKQVKRLATYHSELVNILNQYTKLTFLEYFDLVMDYYFKLRDQQITEMAKDKRTITSNLDAVQMVRDMDYSDCVDILREIAKDYSHANDFINDLVLRATSADTKEGSKLVISTIHSIKGLEYKVVFICDCIQPEGSVLVQARGDKAKGYAKKEMEEQRRILYVAVTRAKEDLHVVCPKRMCINGSWQNTVPIRFLDRALENDQFTSVFIPDSTDR